MKEIKLTHDKFALVDDEDFENLNQYSWHLDGRGYVVTSIGIPGSYNKKTCPKGKHWMVKMHRLIMETPKNMVVDHLNHNPLDNRKCNLRNCTSAENCKNTSKRNGRTSKYLGVGWRPDKQKWRAYISFQGEYIHLGHFIDEIQAAKYHDLKEKELHPTSLNLNFK